MKQILLMAAIALLVSAQNDKNSVTQTLLQIEHDWSEADTHKDAAALNRILADDWMGIDFEGTLLTKPQALAGIDGAGLASRLDACLA